MLDQTEGFTTEDGRKIGGVVMEMKNITLRFGGVVAIQDISFDVREGEIRAIIGPNGAGKSSMLNVISGFYNPQEGEVWYKGEKRPQMKPYQVAQQGIARTFQNIALFDVEVDIPYEPWYDWHARVIDLEPGQMLNWPLNAPHRVENLDRFCVSLSVEFQSWPSRIRNGALYTNAFLRSRGGEPRTTDRMSKPELAARWAASPPASPW